MKSKAKPVCLSSKPFLERKYLFFASLFLFCCIFYVLPIKSYSQELKPLREYENSLKQYYRQKRHIERVEYTTNKEKPYWFFLPDIGLQFGKPSISFRLSNLFELKRERYLQEIKLLSIDYHVQLEMNEKIQALQITYQKLLLENEKLTIAKSKQIKLNELYSIFTECCFRNECTPEDCKKKELENLTQLETIRLQELNYKIAILSLEEQAKYNLPSFDFVR